MNDPFARQTISSHSSYFEPTRFVAALALICSWFAHAESSASLSRVPVSTRIAPPSLRFEPNAGQNPSAARFLAHGPGYLVRLESSQAVIEFENGETAKAKTHPALTMSFVGASEPESSIDGAQPFSARRSYFPKSDPKTWITGLPTYARVNYHEIYAGVDLAFYGNDNRLEYDFTLRPGADARPIGFALSGAENLHLDSNGNLAASVGGKEFELLKPVAYQPEAAGAKRTAVEAAYRIENSANGQPRITFALGNYDRSRPLVIDPVLVYGLFVPAPANSPVANQTIEAMTADAAGNTYVATKDPSSSYAISKFDPNGNLLLSASFGSADVSATVSGIAADPSGNIYVAGVAQSGLVTTSNAYQPSSSAIGGAEIAFLTKINSEATAVLYSSYLGAGNEVSPSGFAVDKFGNAYLTGLSNGAGFPSTANAFTVPPSGNNGADGSFVFISKLNPSLSGAASLVYSALIYDPNVSQGVGPSGGIAVDPTGAAYFLANSSPGFPVTSGAYQFTGLEVGEAGAYVGKLSADGSTLVYSAFLGPGNGAAIAVDGIGETYITGVVNSADFPTTFLAYQVTYAGGFAAKLSADGSRLIYSTFLGGPSSFTGKNVTPSAIAIPPACASSCSAYIAGLTFTTDFPLISPIQTENIASATSQPAEGLNTGFLVELAGNGASAVLSTYLGSLTAITSGIAGVSVDAVGNIYFASNPQAADAPLTNPPATSLPSAYLAKISPASGQLVLAAPSSLSFGNQLPIGLKTTASLQLRNLSSQAVSLTRPFLLNSSEFSESDQCGALLAPGAACEVDVTVTPSGSAALSGTLTIQSSAPNSPAVVPLSGSGVEEPALGASTYSLNFADTVQGFATPAQTITITNYGDMPAVVAPNTGGLVDFTIVNSCPAELAPAASCKISVAFTPTKIGLITGTILIQEPGYVYVYVDEPYGTYEYSYANGLYINLSGTGTPGPSGTGAVALSAYALNFGTAAVGSYPVWQNVTVTNSWITPLTITAATAAGNEPGDAGDFSVNLTCSYPIPCYSNLPIEVAPQQSAIFQVTFQPSQNGVANGTLTFTDSAFGGSQTVSLTGIGRDVPSALSISPSTMVFPAQPVGDTSAPQTFYVSNTGNGSIIIDRALAYGDFQIDPFGSNCEAAQLGTCTLNVTFTPTATGARTGYLKLIDSLGNPQAFTLAGTGIAATGAIVPSQSSLTFPPQPTGTSSSPQQVLITNPGNAPVTVNSITASSDFAVVQNGYYYPYYNSCVTAIAPYTTCAFQVVFTPTKASGAETGTVIIKSTAGTQTISLSGTSQASDQALQLIPSAVAFQTVATSTTAGKNGEYEIYLENTGNEPITFTAQPSITGIAPTPDADFTYTLSNCWSYFPSQNFTVNPLAPGQNCSLQVQFTPSLTSTEQATLTLVDTAGTQTVSLSGTGAAAAPNVVVDPYTVIFAPQAVGTAASFFSYYSYPALVNNGSSSITISSAAITAGSSDFALELNGYFGESCSGVTIPPRGSCTQTIFFQPSVAGYRTGTLTFTDSSNNIYTASLAGYALADVDGSAVSPSPLQFAAAVVGQSNNFQPSQMLEVVNSGTFTFKVGQITSTNVAFGGAKSADFTGSDYCSNQSVSAGVYCYLYISFAPQNPGAKTGTLSIPITYADKTTATLTATVTGTAIAPADSSTLLPATTTFPSIVLPPSGTTYPQSYQYVSLANNGDESLTVGTITGTNITPTGGTGADFLVPPSYCSSIAAGQTCNISVGFLPLTAGVRTGSIIVPVTYADGKTTTLTASFSGTSTAPTRWVLVDPLSSQFNAEVVGTQDTTNEIVYTVTNTGTGPVAMKSATVTPNFTITADSCSGQNVQPPNNYNSYTCQITVAFTPLASTAPGYLRGTLKIIDNAVGGVQTIALGGEALAAAQTLALSQTVASFGYLPIDTSSATQVIYLVDRGPQNNSDPRTQVNSIVLGGTNPSDFIETQNCGGSLGFTMGGHAVCEITVAFAPGAGPIGARSANVTVTPAAGPPLVLQLIGQATAAQKTTSLTPTALSFAAQVVATTSTAQTLQITNLSTRAISIGKVVSTDSGEFSLASDPCSGSSIAPRNTCTVTVTFTPAAAGNRSGSIQVTDDAGHLLQAAQVSGSGTSSATSK